MFGLILKNILPKSLANNVSYVFAKTFGVMSNLKKLAESYKKVVVIDPDCYYQHNEVTVENCSANPVTLTKDELIKLDSFHGKITILNGHICTSSGGELNFKSLILDQLGNVHLDIIGDTSHSDE